MYICLKGIRSLYFDNIEKRRLNGSCLWESNSIGIKINFHSIMLIVLLS